MTKEEWERVRNEPEIPLGVLFRYYKVNGGELNDPVEFERKLQTIITQHQILVNPNSGVMTHVTYNTVRSRVHNYYDTIFGL